MEKVLVVKEIAGMLKVGDILTADLNGDFFLSEEGDNASRYVNIDYVTVSDNIPEYFDYVLDMQESPIDMTGKAKFCDGCFECTCGDTVTDAVRSDEEIEARREFFQKQLDQSLPGSEAEIVFTNLIWFIEWLKGEKNLLK